jgi:hypothetical protein
VGFDDGVEPTTSLVGTEREVNVLEAGAWRMGMEFDLPTAGGILLVIVAVGVGGLAVADMMALSTILMMVLPSMVVFAAVAFWLGMKHGEYRVRA